MIHGTARSEAHKRALEAARIALHRRAEAMMNHAPTAEQRHAEALAMRPVLNTRQAWLASLPRVVRKGGSVPEVKPEGWGG